MDEGMATFEILLDSSEVLVEVIQLLEDSVNQQNAPVSYGELLITEIMYDPAALSDTEGEWFEIYNNSDHTINLQNLILERDGTNMHTITDSIELPPAAFFVFERTDLASAATNYYVYGSDILLPNTGGILSIYNEGTETEPGAMIFTLNYGETDFPGGTGASISLDPNMTNAADAANGTSWCISTSVFSTGDSGTPGVANDSCQ
jgi:hypothetical protein